MTKASDNIFPKLSLVEGAAPASPAATDFSLYFDSADHLLKWKNSAGIVTTVATGASGIAQPVIVQSSGVGYDTVAAPSATLGSTPTVGNRMLALVGASRTVNSITQTNVAWTRLLTNNANSKYCEVWVGVISASPGTSVTVNFTGSGEEAFEIIELDSSAPAFTTAGTPATQTAGSGVQYSVTLSSLTAGDHVVWIVAAGQSSSVGGMTQEYLSHQPYGGYFRYGIARVRTTGAVSAWSLNIASNAYNMVLVKIS